MIKSQFAVLLANLFIIGGLLSPYVLPSMVMLLMAGLWFASAIYCLYLEKIQIIRLNQEMEYYNKLMAERYKNGNRTNKRR